MKMNRTYTLDVDNVQWLRDNVPNASDFINSLVTEQKAIQQAKTEQDSKDEYQLIFEENKRLSDTAYEEWSAAKVAAEDRAKYEAYRAMSEDEKAALRARLEAKRMEERDE